MATVKKVAKKIAPATEGRNLTKAPIKKAVPKSKFKKKSVSGTSRPGPKKVGVLVESSKLVDLIINGPAPKVIPGLIRKMIDKTDVLTQKNLTIHILAKMDEKTRSSIVKRYCVGVKISDENKRLIKLGKGVDRLTGTKVPAKK